MRREEISRFGKKAGKGIKEREKGASLKLPTAKQPHMKGDFKGEICKKLRNRNHGQK